MRLLSALLTTGLISAGLAAAAPAAAAPATASITTSTITPASATTATAGACSLLVVTRFWVAQPYRTYPARQGTNCAAAGVVDAAWVAFHPTEGPVVPAVFENGARSDVVEVFDDMPLGRWTWQPQGAFDANDNEVMQYAPYTDVRLGSYGRLVATRSGTRVNVRTTAMRYWPQEGRFIGWSGVRGQIQYRTPGTTAWRGLKDVYSSSTGLYSYTYTTTATRDYRVVLYQGSVIWGSTSPVVRG